MGSIHMRIAKIQPDPKDKLVIKIFNGTNEIFLRTKTIKEHVDWYNALTNTQKTCNEGRYHQFKTKASARLSAAPNFDGSQNGSIKSPSKPPSESGRMSLARGDDSLAYGFTGSMHERLNMRFFSKVFQPEAPLFQKMGSIWELEAQLQEVLSLLVPEANRSGNSLLKTYANQIAAITE